MFFFRILFLGCFLPAANHWIPLAMSLDVRKLEEGDDAEWAKVHNFAIGKLTNFVFSLGAPLSEARDIADTAVTKLMEKMVGTERGEPVNEPAGLLMRIAQGLVMDWKKKRDRRNSKQGQIAGAEEDDRDGYTWVTSKEVFTKFKNILDTLPPPRGELLFDKIENNATFEELAAKYGISTSKAKRWYQKYMPIVREELERFRGN